jgi:hypothetical protein
LTIDRGQEEAKKGCGHAHKYLDVIFFLVFVGPRTERFQEQVPQLFFPFTSGYSSRMEKI